MENKPKSPHAKRKTRVPKISEMTREQLQKTLQKKKICNERAKNIVESMLEPHITEEGFARVLPHINQSHYDDITEERAIIKLCGYPVCGNALPDNIPKQQYRISQKTNKVYDITVRKNYCSNICYKRSMFIKNQMLTSPLWFRDQEEIPEFVLLPAETRGILGEEIDLSITENLKKMNLESNETESEDILSLIESSQRLTIV